MIIGIDGNEANVPKKVGISEYAFELIREFSKTERKEVRFCVYLKEVPRAHMPIPNHFFRYRVIGPKKLWTQFRLPLDLYLERPRPEVFFSPTHYSPRFSPLPTVISIMDLSYIHFPQMFRPQDLFQLRNWTKYSVKKASKIVTISLASKNDILKEYDVPEDRIVVTYPGVKMEEKKKSQSDPSFLKNKYGIKGDYILFVGTLQPRKNLVRLIEAFSILPKTKRLNTTLVIIGKKGWLYEEILKAPKTFEVEESVKFLDYVEDEELSAFYENALFFVLPSLYEGFGLPVLEAMKFGCPVITSNISSLPEAGGEAAMYIDPEDVKNISESMLELMENEKLRDEMREKGFRQVKKFSWEKTARETLKVLEGVVNS